MKNQSRGGRPSSDGYNRQDDVEKEYGEDERTQKNAIGGGAESGDSGTFGANRGDASIDEDLEEVEREDDSLLASGREDVHPGRGGQDGKSASSGQQWHGQETKDTKQRR